MAKDEATPDIENLYARLGSDGPHLMFAGHTDVVPVGNEADWSHPPFSAEIAGGEMFGRSRDMKGDIACFVAAVAHHIEKHGKPKGSLSFLITGDEGRPGDQRHDQALAMGGGKGRALGCLPRRRTDQSRSGSAT